MPPKRFLKLAGDKLSSTLAEGEETKPEVKDEAKDEVKTEADAETQKPKMNEPRKTSIKKERKSRGSKTSTREEKEGRTASQELAGGMEGLSLEELSVEDFIRRSREELAVRVEQIEARAQDEPGALPLPVPTMREEPEGDDDVFHFLEEDPNAPIVDGGSPDSSPMPELTESPPRGTERQRYDQFRAIMMAAQDEVTKQAREATDTISSNMRRVEERHLRCMERELALQRRETSLVRREQVVRAKMASMRDAEERREPVREHFVFPRWTRRTPPGQRQPQLTRLVNKRGKETYRFIDDISEPLDDAGFIRKVMPAAPPPWLHRGPHRLQRRGKREVRRSQYQRDQEEEGSESDDWTKPQNNPGQGRKRGRKPRGRKFKRARTDGGCYNAPNYKRRDDEEDPPEARGQCRNNHHNNQVYIRQNVNVK